VTKTRKVYRPREMAMHRLLPVTEIEKIIKSYLSLMKIFTHKITMSQLCCVVFWMCANVSEEHAAYII
jgi:hypothetical protein